MPRRLSKEALTKGKGEIAMAFLQEGFNNYYADLTEDVGDGEEECSVNLTYDGGTIDGETGRGHGHAEMDAIHKLWVDVCGKNKETFLRYARNLKLDCVDKPCCVKCSTVLGMLGVKARTTCTKKTKSTMGKTGWGVSPDVRDLIYLITDVPAEAFMQFADMNQGAVRRHL